MARNLPRILITTGDPNGIGPEIAVKALLSQGLHGRCRPLLVGSPQILRKAARTLQVKIPVREIKIEKAGAFPSPFSRASGKPSFLPVIPVDMPVPAGLEPGKIQRQAGRMAYKILVKAHHLIQAGHGDGLATCPIHKEAIHKAGYARVAHTEILSHLTGCADPLTLFVTGRLWIAFFTRHLPLSQAIKAIKAPALVIFVKRLAEELKGLGKQDPLLAMAALNPHSGEGGLLGKEEQTQIIPAINKLKQAGIRIDGPIPADSVFHLAKQGRYDCVISLYHDQGHIAAKTAAFHKTVSLTLGLPYIRTSVDHGTGFDIAGQGIANPTSLIQAIHQAARLAPPKKTP